MASLGATFNAMDVEPSAGFGAVPAGEYNVKIVDTEFKPTQAGPRALSVQMEILDGKYKGQRLFDNLNLENANPKARDIAIKTLSAICRATNVLQLADTEQLHNIPMTVKVKLEPAKGEYPEKNVIQKYSAYVGASVGVPSVAPAVAAPAVAPPAAFAPPPPQQWAQPAAQVAPQVAAPPVAQPWAQQAPVAQAVQSPFASAPVQTPTPWVQTAAPVAVPAGEAPVQQAPPVQVQQAAPVPVQAPIWAQAAG
jgi:hypothetical protein